MRTVAEEMNNQTTDQLLKASKPSDGWTIATLTRLSAPLAARASVTAIALERRRVLKLKEISRETYLIQENNNCYRLGFSLLTPSNSCVGGSLPLPVSCPSVQALTEWNKASKSSPFVIIMFKTPLTSIQLVKAGLERSIICYTEFSQNAASPLSPTEGFFKFVERLHCPSPQGAAAEL